MYSRNNRLGGKGSTTVMMHVPKLRPELPELATAAAVGTHDAATSSQTFTMSSNLAPEPDNKQPCATGPQPLALSLEQSLRSS